MMTSPDQTAGPQRQRRWLIPAAALLAVVVVGVVAALVGYHSGTSAQYRADQPSLSRLRGTVSQLRGTLPGLRQQVAAADARASSAQQAAMQQAQQQYASKLAAASQAEARAKADQRQAAAMLGQLQASQISADGVYVVGSDIKAGTWHTPGDGGSGDQCYYAVLNSTNTSDIADNNNFDGPETVTLSGGAFEINGPCTWYRTG